MCRNGTAIEHNNSSLIQVMIWNKSISVFDKVVMKHRNGWIGTDTTRQIQKKLVADTVLSVIKVTFWNVGLHANMYIYQLLIEVN